MVHGGEHDPLSEQQLQAFVDGELDRAGHEQVERRMAADPRLARRVDAYARQKHRLAAALAAASGESTDPYTQTLADGLARRLAPPRRLNWLRLLGAAAVLVAVGWWGNDLHDTSLEDPVPDLVADGAEIHQLFAEDSEHPVELTAAESAELAEWMTRHFGEPAVIPDLRAIGLAFLGGRLLGSEHGPFAQLLYESPDGNRISLYLARGEAAAGDEPAAGIRIVYVDGLNAGYWQEDNLAYALVAEAPRERLRSIASRLVASADRL